MGRDSVRLPNQPSGRMPSLPASRARSHLVTASCRGPRLKARSGLGTRHPSPDVTGCQEDKQVQWFAPAVRGQWVELPTRGGQISLHGVSQP